jgi:ADP-L-glycero-D-manno-heptose 6-epimerase
MLYVTGAAGFVGSHLVSSLRKSNNNVVCCDIADQGMIQPDNLIDHMNRNDPTIVYHLGAISSTTEYDTCAMTKNNILFSCILLEYCIKHQIPMVYASSASVYGLGENGFSESATSTPLNYYAISKASFDMYVLQKIKDNPSANIAGLRYFNVYGKNEDHKGDMASVIHKFLNQSKNYGTIKVFEGSENFFRDFIHINDVISATIDAKNFNNSGIYNVGTGKVRSFMDVADIISNETGAKITKISFPDHLVGKYQEFTCSDNIKIFEAGHSSQRISLEDGIRQVING